MSKSNGRGNGDLILISREQRGEYNYLGRPNGCNNIPLLAACKKKQKNGGSDCPNCEAIDNYIFRKNQLYERRQKGGQLKPAQCTYDPGFGNCAERRKQIRRGGSWQDACSNCEKWLLWSRNKIDPPLSKRMIGEQFLNQSL
jgi:hypothetical protein